MWPLLVKAIRQNGLQMEDLPHCSKDDKTENITKKLVENWKNDKMNKNPSFGWTLVRTFAKSYIVPFLIYFFEVCEV